MQILYNILNTMGLKVEDVLNSITIFILIFIFSLIGAYLHEVYKLILDKNDRIEIKKIILTSITSTFPLFLASSRIIAYSEGYKWLIFSSFLAGASGQLYIYKFYNGEISNFLLNLVLKRFNIKVGKKKIKKMKVRKMNNGY